MEKADIAREKLEAAWAAADRGEDDGGLPRVGVFGLGVPEGAIAASGAVCVHVNFGPIPDDEPMSAVIEPFVDHEVRVFLNRFALGDFNGMTAIVFARDDAAAVTAYQYATEWVRQGRAPQGVPRLFLFNLVHAATAVARRFNGIQCDKLLDFLVGLGLARPDRARMTVAAANARRRAQSLIKASTAVTAGMAARWRNAGRFLSTTLHADLLEQAISAAEMPQRSGPRLALVGSPIDAPEVYAMLDSRGALVADLQAYGHFWPGPWDEESDIGAVAAILADDPSCPRIVPPQRHRQSLVDRIVSARCNVVVCQLAQTDDTFGWEIPGLAAALAALGVTFVNLGFRDHRPDEQWLAEAQQKLCAALEVAS